MKVKLHGHMDLEQLSHQLQLAIAKLQDANVRYVKGCNFYLTPVDVEGEEVNVWTGKKKPAKEIIIKLDPGDSLSEN